MTHYGDQKNGCVYQTLGDNMAQDRFGYGTDESRKKARKDLLKIINFPDGNKQLKDWLDADPHESDYASYRMILKNLFPGSGLLKGTNKKGESIRQIATYVGPATEEGQKEFESYKIIMSMLADAKGLKRPDAITVSKELGAIYGSQDKT